MSRVSVVIATYNRAPLVGRAVRSALAQQPQPEVIVVDDGSTDDTTAVLAPFGDDILLLTQPNAERGAARNRGVAASSGDYIAFLDSDDEFLPGHLAQLVAALDSEPQASLAHDQAQFTNLAGRVFHVAPMPPAEGDALQSLARENGVVLSASMARRHSFDSVGGFSEDRLLAGAEDWELWVRLAGVGPVVHVAHPGSVVHFHGANSVSDADTHEAAVVNAARAIHAHPLLARTRADLTAREAALAVTRARIRLTAGSPAEARARLFAAARSNPRSLVQRSWVRALASTLRPTASGRPPHGLDDPPE